MQIKAKLSGFDGSKSYEAGDTLTGSTQHNLRLLFNGLADPMDKEAKDLAATYGQEKDDSIRANHSLFFAAYHNLAKGLANETDTVSVKKKAKKKKK